VKQKARADSGERQQRSFRGAGPEGSPPALETWLGWDLHAAIDEGAELLRAGDGRVAVLVPSGGSVGQRVRPAGVTSHLALTSLLGFVRGEGIELWLCRPPRQRCEGWKR
jgi:hypothetical protein